MFQIPRNLATYLRMMWMERMNPAINQPPKSMKTLYSHLPAIMILPAALLLSQCASTAGKRPQTDTVVPVSSQRWVKVSSRPPTFYPRGVAPDSPTDHQSGEWVHTGDAQDTRYFIPLHGLVGVPRQTLVNEALSARSKQKVSQIAAEDPSYAERIVYYTLMTPVWLGMAMASGG